MVQAREKLRVQAAVAAAAGDAFVFLAPHAADGSDQISGEEEEDLVLEGLGRFDPLTLC